MELLKLLNTSEIIAQIISFLLLFFLLRVFLWKHLLGLIDQRKERIAAEFKRIEDNKLEVSKLKSDYQAKLGAIEDLAKVKIEEAVLEGRKATEEIRKKAHLDAQDIIENARENVKYELLKAKEELRDEIVDLTISTAENLIKDKLTEDDDRKLVKDFLEQLDKRK